jgi:allantoinase
MSGGRVLLPTDRLDYAPIAGRRRLELPQAARVVVWVIVNVEEWDPQEPMPRTVLTPPAGGAPSPDIPNWAWHEYGNRIGFWRLIDVLDEVRVRAVLAINGSAIARYRPIAEAALRRGWEFIGHGFSQRNMQKVADERADIRRDPQYQRQQPARLARPRADRDLGDPRPVGRGGL